MFITADMLLAHAIGDYILQTDEMATRKTKSSLWAFIHVNMYTIPFVFLTDSVYALLFIAISHFFIDRFRLARYVIFAKNWLTGDFKWEDCKETGFHKDRPQWLAVWLLIIVDNIMHVICNGMAINYL